MSAYMEWLSQGCWSPCDSLLEMTGLGDQAERICVAGAGGKTTLLHQLAEEYRDRKMPVLVTTTTHMYVEDLPYFYLEKDTSPEDILPQESIWKILEDYGMVFLGKESEKKGKMKSLSSDWFDWANRQHLPLLVEADGARRLPVKIPGEREPVYLKHTTHVFYVYGMNALEKSWKEACFRGELAKPLIGKEPEELIQAEDVVNLASSPMSGRRGVSEPWDIR